MAIKGILALTAVALLMLLILPRSKPIELITSGAPTCGFPEGP
jgi:hypothetical protein